MSHNSTAKVDQKEYLKKYLSGDKCKKKKKKKDKDKDKKQKNSDTRLRIIDDDATAFQGSGNSDDELLLYGEDAPQIVGEFIETKSNGDPESKWRSIAEKDETNVKQEPDDDRWGKKPSMKVNSENHGVKVKRETTPDISPARRRKNSRNLSTEKERANTQPEDRKRKGNAFDQSPPRQRRLKMESDDLSPSRNRKNGVSPSSRQLSGGSRDLSPPRKYKNSISPRRRRTSINESSPRRRHETIDQSRKQTISTDLSPPRKRKNSLSPRRRENLRGQSTPPPDQSPFRRRNDKADKLRQKRKMSRDPSPAGKQRNSLSPRRPNDLADKSPLRRRRGSPDQSPPRRRQVTPPRQQKNRFSSNLSSPNKNRYGSVELSPLGRFQKETNQNSPGNSPRRRRRSSTPPQLKRRDFSDMSPKRRGISPQRQSEYLRPASFRPRSRSVERARNSNSHNSTGQRLGSYTNPYVDKKVSHDNEFSSPGKRQMSSPRRRDEFTRKQSPSRERNRRVLGSRKDNSVGQREMSDQSSPRRRQRSPRQEHRRASPTVHRSPMPPPKATIHWETAAMVAQRKALNSASKSTSPPPTHKSKAIKTLDGKKAGLQDARALKEETAARRRDEEKMFAKMSGELSGRDAEVQVRSTGRRGRRARDAEAEDPEKRRHREEREQQRKEQYDRWGKGLKQIEDHRARLADHEYESSKPLARYADDEDLDRHLREKERAEDPMLDYIRRKRKETDNKTNSKSNVPVYEGSYPENRYGIRPGHRWDGVDRSNGYEKKWFDVQNEKRATQEDAYKYSVEDM